MIRKVMKMTRINDITHGFIRFFSRAIIVLMGVLLVLSMSAANFAFGADNEEEKPVREVHKVTVENKKYCFFVKHNVVLTPAEISGMTDEELTAEIFREAGLYMKETNCRLPSHKAITVEGWAKSGGSFKLKDTDIQKIREAAPSDGNPVKLHMDLRIIVKDPNRGKPADEQKPDAEEKPADGDKPAGEVTPADGDKPAGEVTPADGDKPAGEVTPADGENPAGEVTPADGENPAGEVTPADGENPADEANPEDGDNPGTGDNPADEEKPADQDKPEEKVREYSTFKLLSPRLIFIAVATETDAAYGEDICEEVKKDTDKNDKKDSDKQRAGTVDKGSGDGGESEMLPEYRTISMKDRSGGPLEETLEDGTPVNLEWIEPKKYTGKGDEKSFVERFPGGAAGLTVAGIIVAGLIAAAAVAIKNNQEE